MLKYVLLKETLTHNHNKERSSNKRPSFFLNKTDRSEPHKGNRELSGITRKRHGSLFSNAKSIAGVKPSFADHKPLTNLNNGKWHKELFKIYTAPCLQPAYVSENNIQLHHLYFIWKFPADLENMLYV